MHIWGKGRAAGRVGSGQTFCRQSRVGSGRVNVPPGRVGSGLRKVTRGQLWGLHIGEGYIWLIDWLIFSFVPYREQTAHSLLTTLYINI